MSARQGGQPKLPTPPSGWPIGCYPTYEEAQRAVDYLAGDDFPVSDVTIVGVDLMLVERVMGKLSWGKVLVAGAVPGAWFGLLIGLLLGLFSQGEGLVYGPVVVGIAAGTAFGVVLAAANFGMNKGKRSFTSTSQLVAGRYDVLCLPRNAERGRDLLAKLALGQPPSTP
ncbi:hypothetical protein GCM10025762_58510 [Haloechinothrix salitolerans]